MTTATFLATLMDFYPDKSALILTPIASRIHTTVMATTNGGSDVVAAASAAAFGQILRALPPSCLAVIYFHAPWAEPCKQMSTVISTLASTYPASSPQNISFISLDAEEVSEVSERYNVTQVPHIVLQRDGEALETISGGDASRVRAAQARARSPAARRPDTERSLVAA